MVVQTRLVIDSEGNIVNRILLDSSLTDWSPGEGLTLVPANIDGDIGGTYINGVYTPPPDPPADNNSDDNSNDPNDDE